MASVTHPAASVPRVPSTILSRFTIWCVAVYSIAQGIGLMVGGYARMGGPVFTVIRQLPHAPYVWGGWLSVFGAVLLFASLSRNWRLKAVAILGISMWSAAFSVGAFTATLTIPTAATTGGPVYMCLAFTSAILIAVDERRKR